MPTKVLFLGLDAADPDLLEKWADEGHLPTIRQLLRSSAHSTTENPPGLYVGAVWPSFSTSVSPARHTRYCFHQLIPGNYDSKWFYPTDLQAPFFWQALSEAGKHLAIIDVPKIAVAQESFNGIQIVDWGTHDPEYDSVRTWPASAMEKIVRSFGIDAIHNCNDFRETEDEIVSFLDELKSRITRKTQLIESVLTEPGWDAVLAVFSESHCVGHQCWHLHDQAHPKHDPAIRDRCGDPLLDVYIALDAAVGELLGKIGSDTYCMILASHGMGPHYDASYVLDPILERVEKMRYGASESHDVKLRTIRTLKHLWNRLPRGMRRRWKPAQRAAKSYGLTPNASRRYFQIPNNDVFGAVRINLEGREPQGKVKPGVEFQRVCDELIDDLTTWVNQDTGRPLVINVLKTADVYTGPHLDYLPDLMIEWDRSAPISEIRSPRFGEIKGEYRGCRTGDHKPNGKLFVTGPGVVPGSVKDTISIMDIGPTLADWLGVTLADVDGRVIEPLSNAQVE